MAAPYVINGVSIQPGERRTVDVPVSVLSNHTPMNMSVHVVHGKKPGPVLFVSAAVHGDEIIGVEIVRRLLNAAAIRRLKGTILCVPIVNAFGFINHNRYLPDRRDLNRSFPGSAKGSLAGQLAHLFMNEVVRHADVGIDLHSAAQHRINLPQIRVSGEGNRTLELANAFGAPVILESDYREGSLRMAAHDINVDVLVYEAGEALRFDEFAVRVGVKGILRVMKTLGMIGPKSVTDTKTKSHFATSSHWIRAPRGGMLRAFRTIGDSVQVGDIIGIVSDPIGDKERELVVGTGGVIIGRTNLPVINQGDALFHIAHVRRDGAVEKFVNQAEKEFEVDPLFDEDEIL
ncbi:succinylglutamate desuccinylase/aspartoacylase family protein [Magnetovibrio sp.]|uniref:succinylglutamate desuccinylase/aspartoacylase family protein n=1 Tax=Magnetovibrio sp. TaxID=2024836 RepID=UPI002F95C34C